MKEYILSSFEKHPQAHIQFGPKTATYPVDKPKQLGTHYILCRHISTALKQ